MDLKSLIFIAVVLFISVDSRSQMISTIEKNQLALGSCEIKLNIQQVSIVDSSLINIISDFIKEKKLSDSAFSKYGYVRVIYGKNKYREEEVLRSYTLIKAFYSYASSDLDNVYPQYYTYIDNKLIEISSFITSEVICQNLSKKSKKKHRTIVNSFLPKPESIRFRGADGQVTKVKDFRVNRVEYHTSWKVYIIKDKPMIVIKE